MKCFHLHVLASRIHGYSELRRHILIGAPAALTACLVSPNRLLAALEETESNRQLEDFIDATTQRASQLKSDATPSGQNAYVNFIAEAVSSSKMCRMIV